MSFGRLDGAARRSVDALQELGEDAFAGARWANDGDDFAGG